MNVVFIGCVNFSQSMLQCVLELDFLNIIGIVTKSCSKYNSDFCSLVSIAQQKNIPYFLWDERESEDEFYFWIKDKEPDIIYCFGWSHILERGIILIPKMGIIGYHPSLLPKNRGRHPLIWSLVLGLKYTGSTFFSIEPEIDSGNILDQVKIKIDFNDDANSLYKKLVAIAKKQIISLSYKLNKEKIIGIRQEPVKSSYWRKRNKEDGCIDWRMSCLSIYNLVRALTYPYVGAHCIYQSEEVKIWKVKILEKELMDVEPGKILDINKNEIHIKCGDGIISICDHEFKSFPEIGTYL